MSDLESLKKLFDFTDDDLNANRAGKLSKRQFDHYQQRLLTTASTKAASNLTLVMFIVTFVIFMGFSWRYGNQLGPLVLVAILVWLGIVYIFSKFILIVTRSRLQQSVISQWQKSKPMVEKMTGRLTLEDDGEHTHVILDEFELTNSVMSNYDERLLQLKSGNRYTLYYVLDLLDIVAVEPSE